MTEANTPAVAVFVAVVCLSAVAPPAVAATDTTVGFGTDAATVEPDSTRTFDVVVDSVDGGVGAYDLTVRLDDAVGRIAELTTPDGTDPQLRNTSYDENGTVASLRVVNLDTDDDGTVAVASVTVETADTTADGALNVSAAKLGDEDGNNYSVTGTSGLDLSVSESTGGGGGGSGGGGGGGDDDESDDDTGDDADADDGSDDDTDRPATTESAAESPTSTASPASPTAADDGTTTASATDTQSATATGTTESRTTATGVPGFGVAPAVAATAALLLGAGRRMRREN
ncbi:hypothetical protein [Haloferax sp. KTX1]|uniref:hypothetical protein n=1 Tax=Haloferax sp. KTX1 TaxID=2600597 RepID=UPI0011DDF5E8|nr:hypothetical protein [Haloferax sp. KTX1]